MSFFQAPDVAIDLGTTNTLIYVKGRGIVLAEPTVVVAEKQDRHLVHAIGDDARSLVGRTGDSYVVIYPLENGAISDFDSAEVLLRYFLRKAIGVSHLIRPRVLVSVPSGLPDVSRKAVREAVIWAGAKKVVLVDKPLAAAIGSGLPVYEPTGNMVVDVGGGTTDAAVVSTGGVVVSQSVPVGGRKMDEAIVNYLKKNSGMLIGDRTAEEVKMDLASAMPVNEGRTVQIRGRNLLSSHAMVARFTSAQAHEAVKDACAAILGCIKWVLERTPPELSADVMHSGIHLTGSASQLFALDQFIGYHFNMPVYLAKDPGDCTVLGLSYLIENEDLMLDLMRSNG